MHDPSSSFVVSIRFHIYQQESASPALVRSIALLISGSLYSHPEQRNGQSPRAASGWNLYGQLRWLYFVCEYSREILSDQAWAMSYSSAIQT
jgi:hypothetical protein